MELKQGEYKYGETPEQIEDWKRVYGKVAKISLPKEDAYFYVRAVKRADVSQALTNSASDPLKYSETLCTVLWIAGDERFKSADSQYFQFKRAAAPQINKWAEAGEAELLEL